MIEGYRASGVWARSPALPAATFVRLKASLLSGGLIAWDVPYNRAVDDAVTAAAMNAAACRAGVKGRWRPDAGGGIVIQPALCGGSPTRLIVSADSHLPPRHAPSAPRHTPPPPVHSAPPPPPNP